MVSVRVSPGTRGSGTAAWELRLGEGRARDRRLRVALPCTCGHGRRKV